ncbi:MAG TPA: ABC transporter permease [Candidatus Saccharimonadales bacterium]
MSPRRTLATAGRVLRQLRHDPRTIALVMVVPPVLITLLKYVFSGQSGTFDVVAPMVLGIFPLIIMFIVTSIATLRERTSGTLERIMTLPMSKLDFILGYALAFAFLALIQALIASGVVLGLLGVSVQGGALEIIVTAVLSGVLGMAMGLFVSAFAATEFQAVQFMPAFVFPQLLVCGFFVPREAMAKWLQWLSDILPMTYVTEAMQHIARASGWGGGFGLNLIVTACFIAFFLGLGAVTLRRRE